LCRKKASTLHRQSLYGYFKKWYRKNKDPVTITCLVPRLIYILEGFLDDTHKRGVAYITVLPLHDFGMLRTTSKPWVTRARSNFSKLVIWHKDLPKEYGYLHSKSRSTSTRKLMESSACSYGCSTNHENTLDMTFRHKISPYCSKAMVLICGAHCDPCSNYVSVFPMLPANSVGRALVSIHNITFTPVEPRRREEQYMTLTSNATYHISQQMLRLELHSASRSSHKSPGSISGPGWSNWWCLLITAALKPMRDSDSIIAKLLSICTPWTA
jgi:hypothetical protein